MLIDSFLTIDHSSTFNFILMIRKYKLWTRQY